MDSYIVHRLALGAVIVAGRIRNPLVYGWPGRSNRSLALASSPFRPAYITITRSAFSSTTFHA